MTYAIVQTCGKQYRVEEGSRLRVDAHLETAGAEITLDKVLLVKTDAGVQIGNPHLSGAKVMAQVLTLDRGPKIIVFKKRSKKTYKKTQGHRQDYTELLITKITG
ncbi:MAG: 50S ribosomal protein L21 [Elusimicrobia bacterium RIFCSPLOWO2_01_FULL_59_12]|nr:MAG: 50S ribosomal protein L21 [Elusimicrobia bacterium RIFCSPLOWO2_01_FULL_59_12]